MLSFDHRQPTEMRDDCINKLDDADTQLEEITDSPYSKSFTFHRDGRQYCVHRYVEREAAEFGVVNKCATQTAKRSSAGEDCVIGTG